MMNEESAESESLPDQPDEVELIRDADNLLVVGSNKGAVESFMRSAGLLERAKEITSRQFIPMLRSVAEVTHTVADTVGESAHWVKLTEESAASIKEFGLIETDVPGVSYAMAGRSGDIKQWLKIDTSTATKLASPGMLSGLAGGLAQAASQAEAEQLRALIASLDTKIDKVLRGQRDAIIGPLNGIERHLRSARNYVGLQGEVDSQEWVKLAGVPLRIREIQGTAVEKLRGIAADLEQHKRVGDLDSHLAELKDQLELWVGTIARCVTALDDFAALELEHTAAISPEKLDAKRQAIQADRQEAITELSAGAAHLMSQMTATAEHTARNKLAHPTKSPKVLGMIDNARGPIKNLYDALGLEIDWDSITAAHWHEALLQLDQWKNALAEGGAVTWEKGKPVLKSLAMAGVAVGIRFLLKGKSGDMNSDSSQA